MIPYSQFRLTEKQIANVKRENQRRAIQAHIKAHGVEPSQSAIDSFYTATSEDLERYRRIYYSIYCRNGVIPSEDTGSTIDDDPENMVEVSMDFSTIDDDTLLGTKAGGSNNYQYEYWRILVERHDSKGPSARDVYAMGNFTSLNNVTITLNTMYYYTFYIYLRKSNYVYEKMKTGLANRPVAYNGDDLQYNAGFDNVFKYDEVSVRLYSYAKNTIVYQQNGERTDITEYYTTQNEDKEYIGIIKNFKPSYGSKVTGNVYTLNPRIECTFNQFTQDSGIITTNCTNKDGDAIRFWYSDGVVNTNGLGNITNQSESSFTYTFTKEEIAKELSIYDWCVLYGTQIASIDVAPTFALINVKSIKCDISKDEYIPNSFSISYRMLRNAIYAETVDVPKVGTEVDTGIDVGVVDD